MSNQPTNTNGSFEKVYIKLDTIQEGLHELTLKIERTESAMKERQALEIAKLRDEFTAFRIETARKMTENTVKVGIAFTILMAIITAIIGVFIKSL